MSRLYGNNYRSTITSAITNSGTSIVVNSTTNLPTITYTGIDHYYLTLDGLNGIIEIVKVTSRSGTTLTVVRAQEGTTGVAWDANSVIELRPTAASFLPNYAWTAYTPTFTGFGTATNIQFYSRRVGGSLYIRGRFTCGTSTATEARITLGYGGTNANVTSSNTVISSIQMAGDGTFDFASASRLIVLSEANVGYITFGLQDGVNAGLTKQNGSAIISTGQVMAIQAEIPISGW